MRHYRARGQSGRRGVLVKVGIVVGALAGWLWSGTSLALVITILQITNSGGCSQHPAINKKGDVIAFTVERVGRSSEYAIAEIAVANIGRK